MFAIIGGVFSKWITLILLSISFFLWTPLSTIAASSDHSAIPEKINSDPMTRPSALFSSIKPDVRKEAAIARDRQVIRFRQVRIDILLINPLLDVFPDIREAKKVILLDLFDDVNFVAEMERIELSSLGATWVGRLRGIDHSQVLLVVHGDVVAGNISMPGRRYHIRFAGNGIHEVQEIDTSLFPDDEPYLPVPEQKPGDDPSFMEEDIQTDDGSIIDVMVIYSAAARAAAGGTQAMRALIGLAVSETNQSYLNSGINQRLRLVHSTEVAYPETGSLHDALYCITSTTDGCIDAVHALRNSYGADLVSFWIEEGGEYCGLAWHMATVSSSFASHGFSTVTRSCATGNYSFGHEMGHNMGARHDVYVDTETTPYFYAHGYAYPAASSPWRTIMAYNDACTAVNRYCTRLQYWSNPGIRYGGDAMGDSAADNQQTLDNTAYTVANFRASAPVCSYAISPVSATAGSASGSGSVKVTASEDACTWNTASHASWITVTSGSSGTGSGTVGYAYSANNTGSDRTGAITIAGKTFTLTQKKRMKTSPSWPLLLLNQVDEIIETGIKLNDGVALNQTMTAPVHEGTWAYYYIDVSNSATNLVIDLYNLSADLDLYVRRGSKPTLSSYDCRPYISGSVAEQCSFNSPAVDRWWIGVVNWDTGTVSYTIRATW